MGEWRQIRGQVNAGVQENKEESSTKWSSSVPSPQLHTNLETHRHHIQHQPEKKEEGRSERQTQWTLTQSLLLWQTYLFKDVYGDGPHTAPCRLHYNVVRRHVWLCGCRPLPQRVRGEFSSCLGIETWPEGLLRPGDRVHQMSPSLWQLFLPSLYSHRTREMAGFLINQNQFHSLNWNFTGHQPTPWPAALRNDGKIIGIIWASLIRKVNVVWSEGLDSLPVVKLVNLTPFPLPKA